MKKIFSFLLIALMLFVQNSLANFSDVYNFNKNRTAILALQDLGILEGYEDGTFHPHDEINRAELLKILIEGQGITPDADIYKNCFTDVAEEWFAPYVCYAKEKNWVEGYPDGSFRPEQKISKVENIKIIIKANNIDVSEGVDEELFADTDESQWYAPYLKIAKKKGILEEADGDFEPNKTVKRMSTSENIFRIIALNNNEAETYDKESVKKDLEEIKNNFRRKRGDEVVEIADSEEDEGEIAVSESDTETVDTSTQTEFRRIDSSLWRPVVRVISTFPDSTGFGSGTVISEEGLVLTNAHVVQDDDGKTLADAYDICISKQINISPLEDLENCYSADLIYKVFEEYGGDIALLKINNPQDFEYSKLTYSAKINTDVGNKVRVMGYPGAESAALTNAITTVLDEGSYDEDMPYSKRVMVDKEDSLMDHGISGGAVFDEKNQLVGIPTEGTDENGFYIPAETIHDFLTSMSELKKPLIKFDNLYPTLTENYTENPNYLGGQDAYSYIDVKKEEQDIPTDSNYLCEEEKETYDDIKYRYNNLEKNLNKKYYNNYIEVKYLLPMAKSSLYKAYFLAKKQYNTCTKYNYWNTVGDLPSACHNQEALFEESRDVCLDSDFYASGKNVQDDIYYDCKEAIDLQNIYYDCLYTHNI